YRVDRGSRDDARRYRVYAIVSREALIGSAYATLICAPVYSAYDGLTTQVAVGVREGLKHESAIHCDGLLSVPKAKLTHYVGTLSPSKLDELRAALNRALGI